MTLDEPVSSLRPFRYAERAKGGNCTSILNLYYNFNRKTEETARKP